MNLLLEIENSLNITNNVTQLQDNFLKQNWTEAINNAFDIGLKIALPDYMENEIIEVKDAFLKGGLIEAIKKSVEVTINKGKEILGIFTGNIESISQAEAIIRNGKLLEGIASVLEKLIDKLVKNGQLKEVLGNIIKKNIPQIIKEAQNNIEKLNKAQNRKLERLNNYINNWENYFKQENFTKMQQELKKIENVLPEIMPTEAIIRKVETLKNIHNLVKNNGKNFNLSSDEIELANKLF